MSNIRWLTALLERLDPIVGRNGHESDAIYAIEQEIRAQIKRQEEARVPKLADIWPKE